MITNVMTISDRLDEIFSKLKAIEERLKVIERQLVVIQQRDPITCGDPMYRMDRHVS